MCNVPVTFGGGSWMQNAFEPGCIDGLNSPCDSHQAYHLPSIERGSKLFASSIGGRIDKPRIITERSAPPGARRSGRFCFGKLRLVGRRADRLGVGHAVEHAGGVVFQHRKPAGDEDRLEPVRQRLFRVHFDD